MLLGIIPRLKKQRARAKTGLESNRFIVSNMSSFNCEGATEESVSFALIRIKEVKVHLPIKTPFGRRALKKRRFGTLVLNSIQNMQWESDPYVFGMGFYQLGFGILTPK